MSVPIGDDGYLLIRFNPELLRVGVLCEVDVEAGVVAFGETVLDNVGCIAHNDFGVKRDVATSSNRVILFRSLSISCDSFRIWSATFDAATIRCQSCNYDVCYHTR